MLTCPVTFIRTPSRYEMQEEDEEGVRYQTDSCWSSAAFFSVQSLSQNQQLPTQTAIFNETAHKRARVLIEMDPLIKSQ